MSLRETFHNHVKSGHKLNSPVYRRRSNRIREDQVHQLPPKGVHGNGATPQGASHEPQSHNGTSDVRQVGRRHQRLDGRNLLDVMETNYKVQENRLLLVNRRNPWHLHRTNRHVFQASVGRSRGRRLDREPQLRVGRQQNPDVGQRRPHSHGAQLQVGLRAGQRGQRQPRHDLQDGDGVHQRLGSALDANLRRTSKRCPTIFWLIFEFPGLAEEEASPASGNAEEQLQQDLHRLAQLRPDASEAQDGYQGGAVHQAVLRRSRRTFGCRRGKQ